ncbi:tryptophan--tRNA ligase [Fundidesulfovibrio agrisoli]|uniref:tryptophan--tRNA ligase n=1 Tax=Fundidesulfovibrio agrisoli TaxID=2922717 RepID=UPI001FABA392|nr:tryptophan--tRNA ligase [Fundidesulfovibrio agrisoli]
MTVNKRIVSGMRPTGPLHLGHYFGVLDSWVELAKDHECFFFVADWHALTTEYAEPQKVKGFVPSLVTDWVAAGLDPAKVVMFQQSQVKEHAELHLLLSMITPVGWLERNPTYKDVRDQLDGTKDLSTYGFLGYPVLMASDILIYKPTRVPVGHDQLPHLELTREIARRANHLWGEIFPEPEAKLTKASKLPGLDGRKMSKSYGNAIALGEDLAGVRKRITPMLTCVKRARLKDPGEPNECNLYPYHLLFTDPQKCEEIAVSCREASIGCGECKKIMADNLCAFLEPFQQRRAELDKNPDLAWDILRDGNERARVAARATIEELREKLNFNF